MFLDIRIHNYDKDIIPFIKNGIIVDTSIIKMFIDGLISIRISKKKITEFPDYKKLLDILDLIKVNNKWNKFIITPHILTEVCNHLRNDYCKNSNYCDIVKEVIPFLKNVEEKIIEKHHIIDRIDFENPVIEIGDISIFAVADNHTDTKKKIAILANDRELNRRFQDSPNVMVIDYKAVALNSL